MGSQVFTGVRTILKIRGNQVAYASNVNVTVNHAMEAINTLDRINPIEYAETGYDTSFSCNSFRVADKSAVSLGIQPRMEDIVNQPELSAEVQDRVTGKTLFRIVGLKMSSNTFSVDARGVGTTTWNFVGLKTSDEASE